MFEDILGRDLPAEKDLADISESTIIVCPECGVEMMSLIFEGDDDIQLVDNDYPCKQCSEDKQLDFWSDV